MFRSGSPVYDDLEGLYYGEYCRWRDGFHKHLYDTDKNSFKIKFGDHIEQKIRLDQSGYLNALLIDIVKNRHLMPCIVFDNTDHFPQSFQEEVFQFSQSIRRSAGHCVIIFPVTDHSVWRLSKAGPFQTYVSKAFYLPVPSPREVLQRRIGYIRQRLETGQGNKDARQYFLAKGIRINIDDIRGFAACLEEIFINTDFVSRRIGWLSNHDIRRSLNLSQRIMTSSILSIDELISSYLSRNSVRIHYRKFMLALLFGDRNGYSSLENPYVCNLFSCGSEALSSPLLGISVLRTLIDKAESVVSGEDGYLSVSQLEDYFDLMGVPENAVHRVVAALLNFRAITPYDPSDDTVHGRQRVAISHSGRMHWEMAFSDPIYVSQMAFATPLRNMAVVEEIRQIKGGRMTRVSWENIQKIFIEYCLSEDAIFCRVPSDASYDGQRHLRSEIAVKWTRNQPDGASDSENEDDVPDASGSLAGQSYAEATVLWFNEEKGFGFVALSNGTGDAFFHATTVRDAGHNTVSEGDLVVCDVFPATNGLQIIKIHSVDRVSERVFEDCDLQSGVVVKFDDARGFGFVHLDCGGSDIFVHVSVLERSGIQSFAVGDRVQVKVTPGQSGKGPQAIYVASCTAS